MSETINTLNAMELEIHSLRSSVNEILSILGGSENTNLTQRVVTQLTKSNNSLENLKTFSKNNEIKELLDKIDNITL
jgi:spore coat polysaccharide biosynthesis predicted glycosyltransferase SpsG